MLKTYKKILENKQKCKFLRSHKLKTIQTEIEDILTECALCEHKCKANRYNEKGKCNTSSSTIASHFLHYGEEKVLVPSYTIFFAGCNFECIYCQNHNISQHSNGTKIEHRKMGKTIEEQYKIAKNINWVGGEPTQNILYIIKVLNTVSTNIPQIWNSNMYCTQKTMDILKQIIDIYLTDFKYGNNTCAMTLSNIPNYWNIITRNHKIAERNGEMIIRHLILPNHIECCSKPIIDWISTNTPSTPVNIMNQYYPTYKANTNKEINRAITKQEYLETYHYAQKKEIMLI